MQIGEYIEINWGDDYLPEWEVFYGHVNDEIWAESWERFAGNALLKKCMLKTEYCYARKTKHAISFSETPKLGFSKVTKVYWDRIKFDTMD